MPTNIAARSPRRLPATAWQEETRLYDRAHPRLARMAEVLRRLPQRRLLDVGCSTAMLRKLLPDDFDYYGCDIADHAGAVLGHDRFRQLDFDRDCDLSTFEGRGIDVVHVGGVLEYLERPAELVERLRRLVGQGGRMAVSIINFQSRRFASPDSHHRAWIYRPSLDEFRGLLSGQGWSIERHIAFLGRGPLRDSLFGAVAALLSPDHGWVRRRARQFILVARAA
jgi:SAM-dependent methyltransferase